MNNRERFFPFLTGFDFLVYLNEIHIDLIKIFLQVGNIIINIPVTSKLHNNNNNSLKNLKYLFFVGWIFLFFKIFIHKALFVSVLENTKIL